MARRARRASRSTEHELHERDVVPAPADHAGRVTARTREGGEGVEDRVVQQALMLAAFDVPGQHDVLLAGVQVGPRESGVRPGSPAVDSSQASPGRGGDGEEQGAGRGGGTARSGRRRGQHGTRPVGRRRGKGQRREQRDGREPRWDDELARQQDVHPVGGIAAHRGWHPQSRGDRKSHLNARIDARKLPPGAAAPQAGQHHHAPRHCGGRPREAPRAARIQRVPDEDLSGNVRDGDTADEKRRPHGHRPQAGHRGPVRRAAGAGGSSLR